MTPALLMRTCSGLCEASQRAAKSDTDVKEDTSSCSTCGVHTHCVSGDHAQVVTLALALALAMALALWLGLALSLPRAWLWPSP